MGEKDINILNRSIPKDKLITLLEAEVGRRSLMEFFKMTAPVLEPDVDWNFNFHFQYIADSLQGEVERMLEGRKKERDYVINIPFRSGKSILISVVFPVWCWVRNPNINIISVSATENLAIKFNHSSKMLLESLWFQQHYPDIKLRPDSKSKGSYINTNGGRREAFGINSLVIGSGCNIMLLDDIQSPDDTSPIGLRNTILQYQDVLYSRLNNPTTDFRIIIQSRIHENDICGHLLRTNGDDYEHICLPVVLTEDLKPKSLASAYRDNYFWPERFSAEILDNFKKSMRPNMFAGQLLQRPQLEEGDILKRQWFQTIKLSELLAKSQSAQWSLVLDTAYTSDKKNDPTGIMLVTKVNNILYIRKVWQKWLQFFELLEEIREIQKVYNVQKIYIEAKASGISLIQQLRSQSALNIIPVDPGMKDKLGRVNMITPILESKRVVLVEDPDWNDLFLSECAGFPYGLHDDLVDCLTYSVMEFLNKSGTIVYKFF
jgi:predicted phage terminase large subunit-like protein